MGRNMLIYSGLCFLVLQLHFRENILKYRDYLYHYGATGLVFSLLSLTATLHLDKGVKAMIVNSPRIQSLLSKVSKPQTKLPSITISQPEKIRKDN